MTHTFGYPQSDWDAATREAHAFMVEAVQGAAGTISYGDLTEKITAIAFEPNAHSFHEMLGQISRVENEKGRGMLSAVVVHKTGDKSGQPGEGFFKLARELGRDVRDKDVFWITELRRVWSDCGRR